MEKLVKKPLVAMSTRWKEPLIEGPSGEACCRCYYYAPDDNEESEQTGDWQSSHFKCDICGFESATTINRNDHDEIVGYLTIGSLGEGIHKCNCSTKGYCRRYPSILEVNSDTSDSDIYWCGEFKPIFLQDWRDY